ncbi:acyltransferase family protein [Paenibacillus planticolens]|uniref:Acyltransferase family protein n=1 Tax=Paenibacillus planticolens TaxID=2654976 RepID=A0ABX1ZW17_9BACL|nr:acyltransferase family protein [Paenibacillus planticolens]NOV04001.1 acyltransferase family protein [Paenibacillus planticolens]
MKKRYYYLDHLRVCLTMLLVFHHAAITYGASGSWYYVELGVTGIAPIVLTLFTAVNQAFFLGLFFFLAGYFTPSSYERKGPARFLLDRFVRLGIPTLVYVFGIGPAVIYMANEQNETFGQFYMHNIATFKVITWGPLWFAEALLYFSIVYCGYRFIQKWLGQRKKPSLVQQETAASSAESITKFPSSRFLIAIALLIGMIAFMIRLLFPVGESILGMQFGYFASYIVMFIGGIHAYRNGWLERITTSQAKRWASISGIVIWILPIFLVTQGVLSGKPMQVNGGMNLQSLVYAFWEPFVAVGLCLGLLVLFREKWNRSGAFFQELGSAAFGVYVIHAFILVAVSKGASTLPLPALVKWMAVGTASVMISFAVSYVLRKIPAVNKVL